MFLLLEKALRMPNENIADLETVKPMIHVLDIEATLFPLPSEAYP